MMKLKRGQFAMQGDDVVLLVDDGPEYGIAYCQGWESSDGIEIPVAGGLSHSWAYIDDIVCPETGLSRTDVGHGEQELCFSNRHGIRPIDDPVLRMRAAYTEKLIRANELEAQAKELRREMACLSSAFAVAVPEQPKEPELADSD